MAEDLSPLVERVTPVASANGEHEPICALARTASLEMSVHDRPQLESAAALLAPGTRMYVSHLPGQSWDETLATCVDVCAAGCDPIPHVPVRRVSDDKRLDEFLANCVDRARVAEILLIGGDYAKPAGPFAATMDVLRSGVLGRHGLRRLSVTAYPEGHALITENDLKNAQDAKIRFALENDLRLTLLTQFFFDAAPFLAWRRTLGLDARIRVVAGLAGPAKLSSLFRYAIKCGIGASVRALGARPSSLAQLVGDRGPESLIRAIAAEAARYPSEIHLYSFGGLKRTCTWLAALRTGKFILDENGGFRVNAEESA